MSEQPNRPGGVLPVSRRSFLRGFGTTALASAAAGARDTAHAVAAARAEEPVGPGAVPIVLQINGATQRFEVEPRVTLLELLRQRAELTGAKEVCDRGTCGACTVLVDGTPRYACMTLAIEMQGREIETVEGLAPPGELTPLQAAFVETDALQCGYCTPGFVMSLTALLRENPRPAEAEIRKACSGHLCRCGSYPRVFAAALKTVGAEPASRAEVVRLSHV